MPTPSQPRRTLPVFLSWGNSSLARLMGTAKPMPEPPATMAVLMPTTLPAASKSGPPELPGFIEASVCKKSS